MVFGALKLSCLVRRGVACVLVANGEEQSSESSRRNNFAVSFRYDFVWVCIRATVAENKS